MELAVGRRVGDGEPFVLDGARFNRHTFWCGQSGSGKTYALGVVLERLLLGTGLPMLVLDPNSDFVRFGEPRADAPADVVAALRAADVRVFGARRPGADRLVVRFVDMDLAARAAVLRLDPVRDAEEYHVLLELSAEHGPQHGDDMVAALHASTDPARRRLLLRIENLGVLDWDVWARGRDGVERLLDDRPDMTVCDLGGFVTPEEPVAAAAAILDRLWARRQTRQPLLVVVDEAHNLCPPAPVGPLQRAVTERLIQIAAEGRKFGLWLLLSTQRPSKVHPQVLSQCDNLGIMRMNAPTDLAHLAQFFGGLPEAMLRAVPGFRQGQALFTGGFVSEPTVAQVAARWTHEGGSDVRVPAQRADVLADG